MPTYLFECPQCGSKFDRLKPIKDMNSREKCEKCGEFAKRQLTFPAAIVLN